MNRRGLQAKRLGDSSDSLRDQGVAGFEELDEVRAGHADWAGVRVLQVIGRWPSRRGFSVTKFHDAKGSASGSQNVYAAIFVAFYDVENLRSATDSRDTLRRERSMPEFRLLFQTVFHHFA